MNKWSEMTTVQKAVFLPSWICLGAYTVLRLISFCGVEYPQIIANLLRGCGFIALGMMVKNSVFKIIMYVIAALAFLLCWI